MTRNEIINHLESGGCWSYSWKGNRDDIKCFSHRLSENRLYVLEDVVKIVLNHRKHELNCDDLGADVYSNSNYSKYYVFDFDSITEKASRLTVESLFSSEKTKKSFLKSLISFMESKQFFLDDEYVNDEDSDDCGYHFMDKNDNTISFYPSSVSFIQLRVHEDQQKKLYIEYNIDNETSSMIYVKKAFSYFEKMQSFSWNREFQSEEVFERNGFIPYPEIVNENSIYEKDKYCDQKGNTILAVKNKYTLEELNIDTPNRISIRVNDIFNLDFKTETYLYRPYTVYANFIKENKSTNIAENVFKLIKALDL